MTRVVILAESPLARAGIENLLAGGRYDIVARVCDAEELEEILAEAEPEILLVYPGPDTRSSLLGAIGSSDLARESAIVALADHPAPGWAAEALRAGARAVLPASVSAAQLHAAMDAVRAGLAVFPAEEAGALATLALARPDASLNRSGRGDDLAEPLTRREREVLQMLAGGLANKEIAAKLNLSDHTVKFHVASILGKLGASSRAEAVAMGIRRGLILL